MGERLVASVNYINPTFQQFFTTKFCIEKLKSNRFQQVNRWHFIVDSSIKYSSCFLFISTSPLFKEKSNFTFFTLLPDIQYPIFNHFSGRPSTFSTHNYPINFFKFILGKGPINGSQERNFTRAFVFFTSSIRFFTLSSYIATPIQILCVRFNSL